MKAGVFAGMVLLGAEAEAESVIFDSKYHEYSRCIVESKHKFSRNALSEVKSALHFGVLQSTKAQKCF
jgi:hypothetical protein